MFTIAIIYRCLSIYLDVFVCIYIYIYPWYYHKQDVCSEQLPAEDEVLLQKLREESRAVFLQRKSRELLDNEELQVLTQSLT